MSKTTLTPGASVPKLSLTALAILAEEGLVGHRINPIRAITKDQRLNP